ncbi:MAG: NosD domain-containing protein [Candidatus Bathyarchaeia archaeon]|jgi:parallel beta-helix repeat protein
MKKTAVLALILVCLMASGVVCIRPVKAQYQDDITINLDGSVSPSGAPIQHSGNVYRVTDDIEGSIILDKDNAILDGAGYTVQEVVGPPSVYSEATFSWQVTPRFNDTIVNFVIDNGYIGFDTLIDSTIANNTINGGKFSGIGIGFGEGPCSGCVISGNNITSNLYGITIFGSNNTVIGNYIGGTGTGISSNYGSNNIFIGNYLKGAISAAIELNGCFNNTFVRNEIVNNNEGVNCINIMDQGTNGNLLYCNDFINNTKNVADTEILAPIAINSWDNGTVGNYWDDYLAKYPNATEIDSSGIGDTPYVIDANNEDLHPLMEPFNAFEVIASTPPKISVLSPLSLKYNESSVSLIFTLDKVANWIGYSLDGKLNITVTGNCTVTDISNGLHRITVYANNTFGNMGASTITFTVAKSEPFPTAIVVAVTGASVVVLVSAGLLVYFKKHKH